MTAVGWLQAIVFFLLVLVLTKPLGLYMVRVFEGERTVLTPVLGWLERLTFRLCGIDPEREMTWGVYVLAMLAFSLAGFVYLYALLRTQQWLPFNPQHMPNMAPDLAWNTAVSFLTNTNWQFYSGESAMSYLSQMAGLAWHNFVSAAVGIALAIAVIRGLVRTDKETLGNFWADLVRCCLYVLLPISVLGGLLLVWQGVPQNFSHYLDVTTLDHVKQTITGGPMASQEIIKELGTNGGGFVGANSASPNENPTPLTNLLEMLAVFLIPAALTYAFGRMARDQRQGWALFAAMSVLFFAGFAVFYGAEAAGSPIVHHLGVAGGNLEGKETRFGVAASALFNTISTDTSCGCINAQLDSLTPLGGLVPLINMQLGEIVFGGVGSGLYGMLMFVILSVFIGGLMVGRTPEYLGKNIGIREMKFAVLAVLVYPIAVLVGAGISIAVPAGLATLNNGGPHGFSEVLYAFSSATANNGSAFGGLGSNLYYSVATGLAMLTGRFLVIVPTLALAGSLAGRRRVPAGTGTLATYTPTFVILLISVIITVGALTFVPGDALGPVVEQLLMQQGQTF